MSPTRRGHRTDRFLLCLLAGWVLAGGPARAQEPLAVHPPPTPTCLQAWLQGDKATGDWFGYRPNIDDLGLALDFDLCLDYSTNLHGGLAQGGAFRHLFTAGLTIDPQWVPELAGGLFYLEFQTQNGRNGSETLVGDLQGFDGIDAQGFTQVAELWYRQWFLQDKLGFKAGKMEAARDFAVSNHAGDFLHSGPWASPTILGLPTYPDPAVGACLFSRLVPGLELKLGAFDGATQDGTFGRTGNQGLRTVFGDPADWFFIGEINVPWELSGRRRGRLAAGLWRHTGDFARFDAGREHGTTGCYLLADQWLHRENPKFDDDGQGLAVFVQYGWADENVAAMDHHLGAGVVWTGWIPSRDADATGLMVSYVHLSNAGRRSGDFDRDHEMAFEFYHRIEVTPWLVIQPDFQVILNPGGTGGSEAVVATLRTEIAF